MTILMYIILGSATGIKILLFIYCYALKNQSGMSRMPVLLQKVSIQFMQSCQSYPDKSWIQHASKAEQ